ncbi:protein O-mannosyl-transferase 2 [Elysia marginata]|uniref:Protein O-mannosyl-transferase 2 n=1 Tax=Elysia marginata TaxID=1093978 RepID=A0AAV4EAD7_9GAST|nr:protein O-mannosyl-transferase 2 [Elysia marginata]
MRKHTVDKSTSDSSFVVKNSSHIKAVSDYRLDVLKLKAQSKYSFHGKSLSDKQLSDSIGHHSSGPNLVMEQTQSAKNIESKEGGLMANSNQQDLRLRKPLKNSNLDKGMSIRDEQQTVYGKLKVNSSKSKDTLSSTEKEEKSEKDSARDIKKDSQTYYLCWTILTLLSLLTRLYGIEIPPHVCWDETHFGKMGSWYINRTFFFDVHPPLGKMLIGLAGLSTGYDGSFPFEKPGDPYGDTNYVGMRMFCAVLGAMLVPLAYQSVWLLTNSVLAAMFSGVIILLDTGTLALSRHILLDPLLMFFILLSFYCCLKALSHKHRPFSGLWWFWMSATGVSLACAMGVKFVGLFIVLFVGYTTAADLWSLLGDLSLSMLKLCIHLCARGLCLIALPVLMYCVFFAVHFQVLNHSGNGDGFFSSAFQSQLIGNRLYNISMPQHIAYGSEITLKQRRTGGAYLHSHSHLYPEDYPPRQQQVTTYSHKDENNMWLIKPADKEMTEKDYEAVNYVHSGDLVRLQHIATGRNLHSHKEMAPMTKHHYQVSGYGHNGSGDANDIWIVEVVGESRGEKIQTVRSKVRFIHYNVGCLLHSHDKKLPKWGWEQMEVTCQTDARDTTSAWNVEEVRDSRLTNVSFTVYSPSFLEMFLESHAVMTQGNSGLKPKEGEVTSQPWQWPLNYRVETHYYTSVFLGHAKADVVFQQLFSALDLNIGYSEFPLDHCPHRCVENLAVAERTLKIWPDVKAFLEHLKISQQPPKTKSFLNLAEHCQDHLLPAKLETFISFAKVLQPFLVKHQRSSSILPFMAKDIHKATTSLLCR